jgi:tetratricopeptide (TPR) repeat protein
MTELLPKPKPPSGSGADQSAHIRTLEVQLDYDPNNPSLHAELAWAYLDAGRFDEAIKKFERCYELNINNGDKLHAAKAASAMGHCFLKRSWEAKNSNPDKAQDWRKGIGCKLQASNFYRELLKTNPDDLENKKHFALNKDSIGRAYLKKAEQSAKNPNQAQKYWLRGMKWEKKVYTLFEESSQTDQSTLENCAKTAGHIGQEYLKASKRVWEGNPEQAEQYWQDGMAWKEKAYTSNEELSRTDPSKKRNCALTAAQLGEEFAEKGIDYKAIEWYEKALQHNPDDESVNEAYETLVVQRELEIVRTLGLRTRFL